MKDFICQFPGSLSPEMCDNIINLFEEKKEHHYIGVLGGGYSNNLNKNIKDTIDLNILEHFHDNKIGQNIINNLCIELIEKINKYYLHLDPSNEIFRFDVIHKNKSFYTFLYHKYLKGEGKFTYHNDFNIDDKGNKYRILNYLWYLNDVSEGGETEFFGDYKVKPEKGKMVIFPSEWLFPHCGKIPISGDKHVITGWVYLDI